jgi:hypothetical protein
MTSFRVIPPAASLSPAATYINPIGDSAVSLLLRGEGANNSTTITDSSYIAKTVTAFGNAKISTSAYKFGSASIAFDGSGDYLRIPYDADFNLSSTDFTIEFWINFNALGAIGLFSKHTSGVALDYEVALINSTTIRFVRSNLTAIDATVPALSTGVWYHMAFVGASGSISIYLNGTRYAGPTASTLTNVVSYIVIGASTWNAPTAALNGYMDEIRLSKTARYSGTSFTIPSAQFSDPSVKGALPSTPTLNAVAYSNDYAYLCTSVSPVTWKQFSSAGSIIL